LKTKQFLQQYILRKLTKKQRVCCLKYCLKSHVLQFLGSLHQMFNVSTLLLDDASKRATPLTNSAINEITMLRQFAPLGDDRLLQLLVCRESSKLIDYLLENIPNSIIDRI